METNVNCNGYCEEIFIAIQEELAKQVDGPQQQDCNDQQPNHKKLPGLVLAVVGDSESFVPKPWNTTAFTSGLEETIKGVKQCWIVYRGEQDGGISELINNTFNKDEKTSLIAIRPSSKNPQLMEDSKRVSNYTMYLKPVPEITESKEDQEEIEYEWYNMIVSQFLAHLSKKSTTLLSTKDEKTDLLNMIVPVLMVVAEGDIATIHQVETAVSNNVPVLLIKGSGKASDFMVNYLNEPIQSEKIKILYTKAPLLLGIYIRKEKLEKLQKTMEKIEKYHYLISVFDVDGDDKMEDAIVEAMIRGWSLQDLADGAASQNLTPSLKTITSKVVGGRYGDRIMKVFQFTLTPGSLSLYFYIAYQYIQEQIGDKDKERKRKREELQILLLEAIIADRVDYASAILQRDIQFDCSRKETLYDETLECENCDGKDCRKIHAIHIRVCKESGRKIWCTCTTDCKAEMKRSGDGGKSDNKKSKQGRKSDNSHKIEENEKSKDDRKSEDNHKTKDNDKIKDAQKSDDSQKTEYNNQSDDIGSLDGNQKIENRETMADSHSPTQNMEKLPDRNLIYETPKIRINQVEPADKTTEEDADKTTEEDADKTTEEDADKTTEEDADKTTEEDKKHCTCTCIRHKKTTNSFTEAQYLCQELLNYPKLEKKEDKDDKQNEEQSVYHHLLAWALFAGRKELAGVFWSKCRNPLLTAVMASSILKNMAENVEAAKDLKLHDELLQHSKLFEERALEMQTTLYEEKESECMSLMMTEDYIWGIEVSPVACAYDNKLMDVIGHPCVQRKLNKIWYNDSAVKWTEWIKSIFGSNGVKNFGKAWKSPIAMFSIHYNFVLAVLFVFSAFILTDIQHLQSVNSIGIYEWLLYIWLLGDIVEEVVRNIVLGLKNEQRGHLSYRLKNYALNIWNWMTVLCYIMIGGGIAVRIVNDKANTRMLIRFYSFGLFLLYMRFLQSMLVIHYFGPKIIMILKMLKELVNIGWLLLVFIACTGVLYHANMYPSHYDMWSLHGATYWRIWKIISLPYWQIYGELFLEELQGENNSNGTCTFVRDEWESNPDVERCVEYDWSLMIIAAFYMLITNLLLVNLVIALFTYRFEEVQQNSDKFWKYTRYSIITDYNNRFPVPFNVLAWIPYLIYCCCTKKSTKENNIDHKIQSLHARKCLYKQNKTKK